MNLDDLLSASAPKTSVPEGFLASVHKRVEKRRVRRLMRDTVLLSSAIVVLLYALTGLLTEAIALQSIDFLSMLAANPLVLRLEEGRMALLEMLPLASLSLVVALVALCIWLGRVFVRDVQSVLTSLSSHALA